MAAKNKPTGADIVFSSLAAMAARGTVSCKRQGTQFMFTFEGGWGKPVRRQSFVACDDDIQKAFFALMTQLNERAKN